MILSYLLTYELLYLLILLTYELLGCMIFLYLMLIFSSIKFLMILWLFHLLSLSIPPELSKYFLRADRKTDRLTRCPDDSLFINNKLAAVNKLLSPALSAYAYNF